jgi:ABC-type multidrug transport system, ATPase and permease components
VATFIKLGNNQGVYWKNAYFAAVINKPMKWFDKHNPAELGTSIDMDCNAIEHALGEKIMVVMSSVILFIAC